MIDSGIGNVFANPDHDQVEIEDELTDITKE